MVSGTEFAALKALGDLEGKASVRAIARKAGVVTHYAEAICYSLGKADYMDVAASGMCRLTEKGYQALRARGWLRREDKQGQETEQATAQIGADRFLSGWRQKMERGEITAEEYWRKRVEAILRVSRGESQERLNNNEKNTEPE